MDKMVPVLNEILRNADMMPRSYSGRGMYGSTCLAVTGEDAGKVLGRLMGALLNVGEKLSAMERQELARALRSVKWDSLGFDTIVYFPNLRFTREDEISLAEDDDEYTDDDE